MADSTRRGFLVFAGAGTAAAVGAAVGGSRLLGHEQDQSTLASADVSDAESFVVHVKDVSKGQLAILVGDREVLIEDRELTSRLAGVTRA